MRVAADVTDADRKLAQVHAVPPAARLTAYNHWTLTGDGVRFHLAERLHQRTPDIPVLSHCEPVARHPELIGPTIKIEADAIELMRQIVPVGTRTTTWTGHILDPR